MITTYIIFIKTELVLDTLAEKIRELLNIPNENQNWHIKCQGRESIDHGGPYYYFKVMGFILELLHHTEEVAIDEFSDYPYFLIVNCCNDSIGDNETTRLISNHISLVLQEGGLEVLKYEY